MIKAIQWIGICTTDWNQTVSFYRDVLGLTVQTEGTPPTTGGQDAHWVEMATASGDLVEAFDQNLPERALFHVSVIGFLVDDVASARAELENKGVNFIGPVGRAGVGNGLTSALLKGMCTKSWPS